MSYSRYYNIVFTLIIVLILASCESVTDDNDNEAYLTISSETKPYLGKPFKVKIQPNKNKKIKNITLLINNIFHSNLNSTISTIAIYGGDAHYKISANISYDDDTVEKPYTYVSLTQEIRNTHHTSNLNPDYLEINSFEFIDNERLITTRADYAYFNYFILSKTGEVLSQNVFRDIYGRSKHVLKLNDTQYILYGWSYKNDETFITFLKIDLNSGVIWEKSFDGSAYSLYTLIQLKDKSLVYVDSEPTTMNRRVTKLTPDGEFVWSKNYGTGKYEEISSLYSSYDGNFFIGGRTTTGEFTEQARIMKVNGDGDIIWEKLLDNWLGTDRVTGIRETSSGEIICYMEMGFNSTVLLMKLDQMGNKIWYNTYPFFNDAYNTNPHMLDLTSTDDIVVFGHDRYNNANSILKVTNGGKGYDLKSYINNESNNKSIAIKVSPDDRYTMFSMNNDSLIIINEEVN